MSTPRKPAVAQRLVDAYVTGLRQRLPTLCLRRIDRLPGATEEQIVRLRQTYPAVPGELLYLLQRLNGTYWESIQQPPSADAKPAAVDGAGSSSDGSSSGGGGGASASSSSSSSGSGMLTGMTRAAAEFFRSSMEGPKRKPINARRIAVPILGSALGTCPYYLKSTEDILHPLQQPFPPLLANAPRQPAEVEDATVSGVTVDQWRADDHALSSSIATEDGMPTHGDNTYYSSFIEAATLPSSTSIFSYYKGKRTPIITLPLVQAPSSASGAARNDSDDSGVLLRPWDTKHPLIPDGEFDPTSPAAAAFASAASGNNSNNNNNNGGGIVVDNDAVLTCVNGVPMTTTTSNLAAAAASASPIITGGAADQTTRKKQKHPRCAYVDPRIDIYADFTNWLAFADSMYPHHPVPPFVAAPTAADADPTLTGKRDDNDDSRNKTENNNNKEEEDDDDEDDIPLGWRYSVSRLYIDFSPNEVAGGVMGQVIQYSRKPETFRVIAPDFGAYLKFIMTEDYDFTEELEDDEDEDEDEGGNGAQSIDVRSR